VDNIIYPRLRGYISYERLDNISEMGTIILVFTQLIMYKYTSKTLGNCLCCSNVYNVFKEMDSTYIVLYIYATLWNKNNYSVKKAIPGCTIVYYRNQVWNISNVHSKQPMIP